MTPHGPDADTTKKAENAELTPIRYPDSTMAFMFESSYVFKVTPLALETKQLQHDYFQCWQDLDDTFTPPSKK